MQVTRLLFVVFWIAILTQTSACLAGKIVVEEYAPKSVAFPGCTHLLVNGRTEIVTAGNRLFYRKEPGVPFQESPLEGLEDAHSVAFNPRDRLFYVTDTANHRLRTFRNPAEDRWLRSVDSLAGVKLDRPHDIVVDEKTGWLYALNPNNGHVFRFKSLKEKGAKLDLSKHLGYSRALTMANGKLYVVGSSRGAVIEIDDFSKQKYTIHTSFEKKREAVAGSWKSTGLVLNDVDFFKGYWYATSYFCPAFAAGQNCNENKFIRFKTWHDFQAGIWEDLSRLLPKNIVPYYLTPTDRGLFIAVFRHEEPESFNKVFRLRVSE